MFKKEFWNSEVFGTDEAQLNTVIDINNKKTSYIINDDDKILFEHYSQIAAGISHIRHQECLNEKMQELNSYFVKHFSRLFN